MKTEGATLNGFLDRGSHLTGELKFDDGFRIDGKFDGKITSGSDLVIGENADVEADSGDGRIIADWVDRQPRDDDEDRDSFRGRLGTGGPVIRLRSGDGAIDISRR